ncbi:hypothetical protein F5B20DRAFT_581141 [Whalleya microplaca]|nr:hypothetical protein F5B20DRAFT_581141 [Whalleya microplaca]
MPPFRQPMAASTNAAPVAVYQAGTAGGTLYQGYNPSYTTPTRMVNWHRFRALYAVEQTTVLRIPHEVWTVWSPEDRCAYKRIAQYEANSACYMPDVGGASVFLGPLEQIVMLYPGFTWLPRVPHDWEYLFLRQGPLHTTPRESSAPQIGNNEQLVLTTQTEDTDVSAVLDDQAPAPSADVGTHEEAQVPGVSSKKRKNPPLSTETPQPKPTNKRRRTASEDPLAEIPNWVKEGS